MREGLHVVVPCKLLSHLWFWNRQGLCRDECIVSRERFLFTSPNYDIMLYVLLYGKFVLGMDEVCSLRRAIHFYFTTYMGCCDNEKIPDNI